MRYALENRLDFEIAFPRHERLTAADYCNFLVISRANICMSAIGMIFI